MNKLKDLFSFIKISPLFLAPVNQQPPSFAQVHENVVSLSDITNLGKSQTDTTFVIKSKVSLGLEQQPAFSSNCA